MNLNAKFDYLFTKDGRKIELLGDILLEDKVLLICKYPDFKGFVHHFQVQKSINKDYKNRQVTRYLRLIKRLEVDLMQNDFKPRMRFEKQQRLQKIHAEEDKKNVERVLASFESQYLQADYKSLEKGYDYLKDDNSEAYRNLGFYLKKKAKENRKINQRAKNDPLQFGRYLSMDIPVTKNNKFMQHKYLNKVYDIDLNDRDTLSSINSGIRTSTVFYQKLNGVMKQRGIEVFQEKVNEEKKDEQKQREENNIYGTVGIIFLVLTFRKKK